MSDLKMGDIVEVEIHNVWEDRIFIKYGVSGGCLCVEGDDSEKFENGEHFYVTYWDRSDWRIKKEQEYIPFDIGDAEFLIGMKIRRKQDKMVKMITAIIEEGVFIVGTYKFDELLENYEQLDGSPCGKLI